MKRSNRKRHRPEEVVAKLRQADEALAKGTPLAEVARSLGVSEVTLHRWRAEYGTAPPNPYRDKLGTRMRELAVVNPRRGRRSIMDLLRKERWSVGARLMKRLWRRKACSCRRGA